MNEHDFSQKIRLALDESAEKLPYRIALRLQQARQASVSHAAATPAELSAGGIRGVGADGAAYAGMPAARRARDNDDAPRWLRLAWAVVPGIVVAVGLVVISDWSDTEIADEIAELDSEVLAGEVPISAYADRGFGVYLKNSRQ